MLKAKTKGAPKATSKKTVVSKIDPTIQKTIDDFGGIWTDQEAEAFAKRIGRKLWAKKLDL